MNTKLTMMISAGNQHSTRVLDWSAIRSLPSKELSRLLFEEVRMLELGLAMGGDRPAEEPPSPC